MKPRTRTLGTLLILVLPLVLWFMYFNALYAGQTLACLSSEPASRILLISAFVAGALSWASLLALAVRSRTNDVLRRNGIGEVAILSAIGIALVAVAMLAIPLC